MADGEEEAVQVIDESFFTEGQRFTEGGKLWEVVKVSEVDLETVGKIDCVFYYGVKANPDGPPSIDECEYTPVEEMVDLVQKANKKKMEKKYEKTRANLKKRRTK